MVRAFNLCPTGASFRRDRRSGSGVGWSLQKPEEPMFHHLLRVMWLTALLLSLTQTTLSAQDKPVRVRGTIDRVEGDVYVVKARGGAELKVTLADKAPVTAVVKASLADVKQGSYVGIASMPQSDGSQKALEVLIFPEAMRGVGEGHYGWDLQPASMMTNGNVEQTVTSVDGQVITVKYKDGEKKIVVPPDAPIVSFVPGDMNELKPSAAIFVAAAKPQPDGSVQAPRIAVGREIVPPM